MRRLRARIAANHAEILFEVELDAFHLQSTIRIDAHTNATRNLSAPTRRQNTESGGIRIDVTTISATWLGAFDVPRSRCRQKRAVRTSHGTSAGCQSGAASRHATIA